MPAKAAHGSSRATPTGPWLLADSIPPVIHTIPPTSPLYNRHLCAGLCGDAGRGHLRIYRRLHARLRELRRAGLWHRLLLSAGDHRGTGADLLSLSVHLCRRGLVQHQHRRLGARRHDLRAVWRRGDARQLLQPQHRRLGAWRGGLRTEWRRRRVVGLQPEHRQLRARQRFLEQRQRQRQRAATTTRAPASPARPTRMRIPTAVGDRAPFPGRTRRSTRRAAANANGRAGGFNSSTGAKGAGYQNNVTGGTGGVVKTQNGDVYAGHDGNVYQHTDSGWSKYDNGSWNPVQTAVAEHNRNLPRPTNPLRAARRGTQGARGNAAGWKHGSWQLPAIGTGSAWATSRQRPVGR